MFKKELIQLIIIIFLLTISCTSQSDGKSENIKETAVTSFSADRIHFGSKGNPLNGLIISWRGLNNSQHKIRWGYTDSYEKGIFSVSGKELLIGYAGQEISDGYLFNYTFPDNLKPESIFYYSIYDGLNWCENNTFKTSKDPLSKNFTFLVGGDIQHNMDVWNYATNKIVNTYDDIDFILQTGDFVDNPYKIEQWNNIFKKGEVYLKKFLEYKTIGNHDLDGSNIFLEQFTMPENKKWWSFEFGDVLFINLLSNIDFYSSDGSEQSQQYQWLLKQLQNSTKKWKVVLFHRPFFCPDSYGEEMHPYFDTIWKAFDDYGVDVIFNGHMHYYMRTKPINRNISINSPVAKYGSNKDQGRLEIITGNMGSGDYDNKTNLQGFATPIPWYIEKGFMRVHYIKVAVEENKISIYALNRDNILFDEIVLEK